MGWDFATYPSMGYGTAGAEIVGSVSTLLVVVLEPDNSACIYKFTLPRHACMRDGPH